MFQDFPCFYAACGKSDFVKVKSLLSYLYFTGD
jgi:hypothetical protein